MAELILASLAAACGGQPRGLPHYCVLLSLCAEEGLGNVFIGKLDGRQTCVTLGLAAIFAAVLLPGMHGVGRDGLVTMVAIFLFLGQLQTVSLAGGKTGDTLGDSHRVW